MAERDRYELAVVTGALAGGVAAIAWILGRAVERTARAVGDIGVQLINPAPAPLQAPVPVPVTGSEDLTAGALPWESWPVIEEDQTSKPEGA